MRPRSRWEFGGGDRIAVVSVGTVAHWQSRHAWSADRRGEILGRVGSELVGQRAPTARVVADERAGKLELVVTDATAPRPAPPGAASLPRTFTELRAKMAMWVGGIVLLLALVAWIGRSWLTIATTGTPLGASVRVGDTIATLIQRLEGYVPSLHRDHSKDRYSVGLLLHTAGAGTAPRYVEIARGHTAGALQLSKFLECDAERLRFRAPEPGAYDLDRGRLLGPDELRREPPPAPTRTHPLTELASGDDALLLHLAAAGRVSATRWLGVLTAEAAARDHAPGSVAPSLVRMARSSQPRALYVGDLAPDGGRARLTQLRARAGEPLFNGAFVRAAPDGELLRLADPAGLLLLHETQRYRGGTVTLTRVDDDGREVWRRDLGIGELWQVLPDVKRPAFIGTRPRVPDKVSEPILVIVDAGTGEATIWSLWWTG